MLRSAVAFLLIAPLVASGADEDLIKVERQKLQGTWIDSKGYNGSGEQVSPALTADHRMTISGETLTNESKGRRGVSFKFTLDPSRTPKAIDMIMREGSHARPGIYRVDGDTLEIAWSASGAHGRPPELIPCPKDSKAKWTYAVYRRDTGPSAPSPVQAARDAATNLEAQRPLVVGQPAPEIEGPDLDGKPLKLSDYRGKVVVLVFWGSWCGPCMNDVPHERAVVERFKGRPFAMLGVDCNDEKAAALKKVQEVGINWPSWYDDPKTDGPIAARYHVSSYPSVFVIDGQGIIRATDTRGEKLDRALEPLLKEVEKPTP